MNCSKANKSLKLEHIFDDLGNSVVTDDLAFGEMTGALTFIKLTQRTGLMGPVAGPRTPN